MAEASPAGRHKEADFITFEFLKAYDRLADGIPKTPGLDGNPVIKVLVDAIRDEMKSRGFLEKNDKDGLTSAGRSDFQRAKNDLLQAGKLIESDGFIWRP